MAILSVTSGNPLLWTFLMENFNLGIAKMMSYSRKSGASEPGTSENLCTIKSVYKETFSTRYIHRALNMVQEYVGCCGSTGSDDYNSALKAVPNECRDPVTGLEYPYGCSQQFAWWLEPWTCAVAGLTSGLVLLHIAQIIIGTGIKNKLKDYFYHFDNDSYLGDVDANSYF